MSEINTGNVATPLDFVPEYSTDAICVGGNASLCLTDHLDAMETDIAAKAPLSHSHAEYLSEDDAVAAFAPASHTHANYLTEDDAVATFAMASHTHTGYAASSHTHSDLETAIEALDTGKAGTAHTHAQADVTGLVDKLAEIDEAIAALQAGGSAEVTPMLTLSMHLGKLDNNSGAEVSSSTRICSDPFAVENGKSYWQVNDKAVNMYVLLYDADEVFLEYMGNFASGAEIAVTNANAAYMRLGSLLGEYDLTNNFYIYNVDPVSGGTTEEEAFTQAEADLLYAPISHTHSEYAASEHTHDYAAADHSHTGYAAAEHTHDGYAASAHTHTAADITGLPSSVDAYSKTESDAKYALASHTHDGYAAATHTHSDYLTEDDAVDAFAGINHTHSGYAASGHTHTASEVGAAAASHTHTPASIGAAASSHTHSEYAASNHGHSDYASSSHTHSYLPLSGGTVTGETNFSGGLVRVGGQQAIYDSGTMVTLSTNNRETMIAGSKIYSKVTIAVSSDARLKENILPADEAACVALIDGIKVKTFNYIGNETPCMGVIAQDLQNEGLSKFFVSMGEEGYLSVKATDLVFPLIATVQALTKRVEELERK